MPSIKANQKKWGTSAEWERAGDQWSDPWGGPENQWHLCIFPRVSQFLPADTVLEIAPGFGRWTQFLYQHAKALKGVDLNQNCIDVCRKRFPRAQFFLNDGKSLGMIEDNSVDFVFSFDSLVHVESDVMDAYLSELSRILKPNGAAFLHHSNYGAHLASPLAMFLTRIPVIRRLVINRRLFGVKPNPHWRAESVSAELVRGLITKHGMYCCSQELVSWGADYLNDCFTTISRSPCSTKLVENYQLITTG